MAQTKRKRQTKHRGNAAGVVESRGRTGRPGGATTSGKGGPSGKGSGGGRSALKEPTWQSSAIRAAITSALLVVFMIFAFKKSVGAAVALAAFAFVIYVPIGYYADKWFFDMRKRKAGK